MKIEINTTWPAGEKKLVDAISQIQKVLDKETYGKPWTIKVSLNVTSADHPDNKRE